MRYRIIKETTGDVVKFYIEKRHSVLFYKFWSKLSLYHPVFDITLDLSYDSIEEAKEEIKKLTTKTIIEVV
jgi:hypothetical protein